jgi:hypothetical protein
MIHILLAKREKNAAPVMVSADAKKLKMSKLSP